MSTNSCTSHNLWFAHSPTPSVDCAYVYVICGCTSHRRRRVTMAQWQAEEQRRAERPQGEAVGPALMEGRTSHD